MKRIIKLLLLGIACVLLVSVFSVNAFAKDNVIENFFVNTDSAENSSELGAVEWFKGKDGVYYIFLPSSADRTNMTVWFDADSEIMCGETKIVSGEKTAVFANGDDFVLTCGTSTYNVKVLQSKKQGTIYLNTETGSMDAIHADKSYKEEGSIIILDKDGNVEYSGALDYIKGRGNTSWAQTKKPYNIKLNKKADLFGMGKDKKWCLIANSTDATMLRNSLVFDLAYNIGVDTSGFTHQVNLYLNGEYAGLYMLTEKVDIGESRIDIFDLEGETEDVNTKDLDKYPLGGVQNSQMWGTIKYAEIPNNPENITGGYILELEKIYRYPNEASGFISDIGQAVVVKTPEYASKAQIEYISKYYQAFEDALYSSTGYNSEGKHYSEYIDVASLARMYVIMEFTSIFDGCSSSFFMWKDVDGKITFGPAWDYDNSLGHGQENTLINHVKNTADPNYLFIQTTFIGKHAEYRKSLLAQAFTHNDFQEKVEEIWATDFASYFNTFYGNIDAYTNEITESFVMNAVRWNYFGTTDLAVIENKQEKLTDDIYKYVDARYDFLQNVYDNDTYLVKYDVSEYGSKLVHDLKVYNSGATASVLEAPEGRDYMAFVSWTDDNGNVYKAGDKLTVTDNITLHANWEAKSVFGVFFQKLAEFFDAIIKFFANLFSF